MSWGRAEQRLVVNLWLWLLFGALAFWLSACGGGGRKSPLQAHEGVSVPLSVSGGTVVVTNRGCSEVDLGRVASELETAWRRAVREEPRVAEVGWLGFRVVFDPRVVGDDYKAYYDFPTRSGFIACGAYGGVEHEPGHHWCHVLAKGCCEKTWHPAWDNGVDLACKRRKS